MDRPMRILSLTAGAAGMYCGSCLRDNALAAELMARGHDVTLQPVYTPTRTDEPNVSQPRVLFGGINVYLQQRSRLYRQAPALLDWLIDAPALIGALANRASATDPRLLGDLAVSMLDGEAGVLRREFEKLIEWAADAPPPDVVNLPNSLLIGMAAPLRRVLGRPVCCTLQGEELFLDGLVPPYRDEVLARIRARVGDVDRFVAVSDYCAAFMGRLLAIPASKMAVVPLGVRAETFGRRPARSGGPFQVGYLARIAPEKGLRLLAEAYVRFRRRSATGEARLHAAGYLAPADVPYLDEVRSLLAREGLAQEFDCHGEVDLDRKIALLGRLDVFSVPATYDEPKGLFLLEAMASSVPVVQPRRGAFVEIVERTGGGLLVEPDDPDALADGLWTLWQDRARAEALGRQAAEGVRTHYTIGRSADRLLEVYRTLVDTHRPA